MKTTALADSAKDAVQKLFPQAQEFASHEPKQATAAVIGLGLGLRLLPAGLLFRTIATVASTLARPALLTLGALKVYEMSRKNTHAAPAQVEKHSEEAQVLIAP